MEPLAVCLCLRYSNYYMKAVGAQKPKSSRLGRAKIASLLVLFVVGSVFSVITSLVQPITANALTAEQRQYCLDHFPPGTIITITLVVPNQITSTKSDPPQDWVDNTCSTVCKIAPGMEKISPVERVTSCDANAPLSIDASPVTIDAVKKGFGDSAVEASCGTERSNDPDWAACVKTMRNGVSSCIDEYVTNAPANAPEFPLVDTDWLVECMGRDGKLTPEQKKPLRAQFKKDAAEIAKNAKEAELKSQREDCEANDGTWIEDTEECGTKVTCTSSIQGVGYIVCPAMNFIAETSDWAYGFLASNFLSVNVGMVDGVKDSWAKFRDIANIAFVIALLIVIYSQITSVGISNYGIKKMLPKIVIAAILVNVSYDICRIAVDLSNILGYGIAKFFENNFGFTEELTTTDNSALGEVGEAFTMAAAWGLAAAGAIGVAIAVGVPVLLSAMLALGLIVLILLLRQALIILLIAIAPLAFVAYLLPNTEQWYKKWLKLFSTLLLLFPIVGLVFGASKLAANIMLRVGADQSATGQAGGITQMLAIGVLTVPFFVVPGLLKGSLNAIGGLGGKLSGWADKATGSASKNLKDKSLVGAYKKSWDRNQQIKRAQILGGTYKGKGLAGLSSRINSKLNASALTGKMGTDTARQAAQMANKLQVENVEAAKAQIDNANLNSKELAALARGETVKGINGKDASNRAAAVSTALDSGKYDIAKQGWDAAANGDKETQVAMAGAIARSQNRPAFIGQGALAKMRGDRKDGEKVADWDTTAREGVAAGAYSPEGIAKASKDELEEARRVSEGHAAAEGALKDAAIEADNHADIRKTIGKTRGTINRFKDGNFSPPPPPPP